MGTDNCVFAWTICGQLSDTAMREQIFVPTDGEGFVPEDTSLFTRTMKCSWERTIVRSHGQLFVLMDIYLFPWIIIRSHG